MPTIEHWDGFFSVGMPKAEGVSRKLPILLASFRPTYPRIDTRDPLGCNRGLFRRKSSDETYLSAVGRPAQAHTRVPGPHEDPRRSRRDSRPPREGSKTTGHLTPSGSDPSAGPARGPDVKDPPPARSSSGRSAKVERGARRRRSEQATEHFSVSSTMVPVPVRYPLRISVPKKLLPRAVDRNLVKRIVREAWRAVAKRAPDRATHEGTSAATPSAMPMPAPTVHALAPSLLVRLRTRPAVFADGGVTARRRLLRTEVDRLLRLAVVR